MRIHHVNIRTKDLDASIAFYRDALGLRLGERPDFGFPGAWPYDEDKPAVHLNEAVEAPSTAASAFDHVAFFTDDLDAVLARLDDMGVHTYGLRPLPDGHIRQCFMKDPNGISVEITGP
jgi:catechol 2,3-dioxygenase-like lactoylglutathione lyase family enzyme